MTLNVGALSTRVVPAGGVPPKQTYSSNEKEHYLSTDDFIYVRPLEPRRARSPDAGANTRGSRWIRSRRRLFAAHRFREGGNRADPQVKQGRVRRGP